MSKKAGLYTLEFKKSSAKLAIKSGQIISQIARNLGIKVYTLYNWIVNMPKQSLEERVLLEQFAL